MPAPSNYIEIAKEIMVVDNNMDRPQFIIERHARTTGDNKIEFYKQLIFALSQNETFNYWRNKKNEPVVIKAVVNGKILQINKDSQGDEPYIVLEHFLVSDKPRPDASASDGEKLHYVLDSDYMDLCSPSKWHRSITGFSTEKDVLDRRVCYLAQDFNYEDKRDRIYFSNFSKRKNDLVNKGDIIVVFEDFTPTPEAQTLNKVYDVAKGYCETKLIELTKINDETTSPTHKLNEFEAMWDNNTEEYKNVIAALKENNKQISGSFIKEINGKLYWIKKPSKGWQIYLTAFLYTCHESGFIDISEYSFRKLKDICISSFNTGSLDQANFNGLHSGQIKEKKIRGSKSLTYCQPFIDIMNKIK